MEVAQTQARLAGIVLQADLALSSLAARERLARRLLRARRMAAAG